MSGEKMSTEKVNAVAAYHTGGESTTKLGFTELCTSTGSVTKTLNHEVRKRLYDKLSNRNAYHLV